MTSRAQVADILVRITDRRRERLAGAARGAGEATGSGSTGLQSAGRNAFLAALEAHRGAAVIAEVKMGSPKLGSLAGRFDPAELARGYAAEGAAALSVVVEPDFFYGSYELLALCREASGLPAIAKDFVVDTVQLRWARRAGASAVLLIAALYDRRELLRYARAARRLGLAPLIELHDEQDVAKLAGEPWELVGVNNRDLRSFEVDLGSSIRLASELPRGALRVSESGLRSAEDLRRLGDAGYDAFLIGEALVTSTDPGGKLRELLELVRPTTTVGTA